MAPTGRWRDDLEPGELISPGDIIVGDDDGVVVVRQDVASLAKACAARDAKENELIELHKQGKFDFEERYAMMRSKGCTWSD